MGMESGFGDRSQAEQEKELITIPEGGLNVVKIANMLRSPVVDELLERSGVDGGGDLKSAVFAVLSGKGRESFTSPSGQTFPTVEKYLVDNSGDIIRDGAGEVLTDGNDRPYLGAGRAYEEIMEHLGVLDPFSMEASL